MNRNSRLDGDKVDKEEVLISRCIIRHKSMIFLVKADRINLSFDGGERERERESESEIEREGERRGLLICFLEYNLHKIR